MIYKGFVGQSYVTQSSVIDGERCVNFYPEAIESQNGTSVSALYPTPGFIVFANALAGASGPVMGMLFDHNRMFAVVGTLFVEVDQFGIATQRGIVSAGANPAYLVPNGVPGHQILVLSGGLVYIFDTISNAFTAVDPTLVAGTHAAFLDGYFLVLNGLTGVLHLSALDDGLSWDPADVATRSVASDPWIGMIINHDEAWLFGDQTSEVWKDQGDPNFPIAFVPGSLMTQGLTAPYSVANIDNSLIWCGKSSNGGSCVYRSNGYTPVRVSTHAIEYAISRLSTLEDATAWSYTDQGHAFWILTFDQAGATFVYDCATSMWHERAFWNQSDAVEEAYRVHCYCYAFGKHMMGDRTQPAVYQADVLFPADVDGNGIRRIRQAPVLSKELERVSYPMFQVDLEAGLGQSVAPGDDPTVMAQWSNDGGKTWSNEHWKSAGKIGEYLVRPIWRKTGLSRRRVFRLVVCDPIVNWRLSNAYLEVA